MIKDKTQALRLILIFGVVSLCADIVYEGGRSISGPFLFNLGASAAAVGILAGLSEFAGYGLRFIFGYFVDRFKNYWGFNILGYALGVLSIPFLAFAGRWEMAGFLLVLERMGKAMRSPARDVLLSFATEKVGRGKGFGIHEAMDQIGAISGPLLMAGILYFSKDYRLSFLFLFIPAILAMSSVFFARLQFPLIEVPEPKTAAATPFTDKKLPALFWLYVLFIVFTMAGYAHFPLISFHFKNKALFPDVEIPLLFALAMAVDGVVALIIGRIYDRIGLSSLISIPVISLFVPVLAFSQRHIFAVVAVVLWGAAMGIQETVMRAAIADLTVIENRGLAYGVFNSVYGLGWFLGNSLMGILYARHLPSLIAFCVIAQIISLFIFMRIKIRRVHL